MFMIVQAPQITQATVIAIIVSATIVVVALLALIGYFASKTPEDQEGGPLHFGNFFVVALGIMTALIGFLVAFPLLISGVFEDPTQVIALLSALFGTIVGLVGTYFGVKSSSDASRGHKTWPRRLPTLATDRLARSPAEWPARRPMGRPRLRRVRDPPGWSPGHLLLRVPKGRTPRATRVILRNLGRKIAKGTSNH